MQKTETVGTRRCGRIWTADEWDDICDPPNPYMDFHFSGYAYASGDASEARPRKGVLIDDMSPEEKAIERKLLAESKRAASAAKAAHRAQQEAAAKIGPKPWNINTMTWYLERELDSRPGLNKTMAVRGWTDTKTMRVGALGGYFFALEGKPRELIIVVEGTPSYKDEAATIMESLVDLIRPKTG